MGDDLAADDRGKKTFLDRALSVVTEIRPREGALALLLSIDVCLLLTAYYMIKPVREGLILATGGAEIKSYAAVGQILLLAAIVPAYGALAARVSRRTLMRCVTFFFCACLVTFYLLEAVEVPHLGVIFYLWVGIFSLMVVAQFWSFATDIYTKEQGERLLPVAGFGASAGAVVGSQLTSMLVGALGVYPMLLVSAVILLGAHGVTEAIELLLKRRHEKEQVTEAEAARDSSNPDAASDKPERSLDRATPAEEPSKASERGAAGGFRSVLANPYLRLVALIMLLANLVNTTGEYVLGRFVTEKANELHAQGLLGGESVEAYIGEFYAQFFLWVNVLAVSLQFFAVSRIVRYAGVALAILVLPSVALLTYVSLAIVPVLQVVRWVKTLENATDYSLNNTVRNALFLPLTRQEKYEAKQAIDTFFVRGGDVLSAGLVFVGTNFFMLSESGFAWINVGLVVLWILVTLRVGARYRSGKTGVNKTGVKEPQSSSGSTI